MKSQILKVLSKSQLVSINRPNNFREEDELWFPHWGEYKTNDIYVYDLKNVTISGDGIVFDKLNFFEPTLFNLSFKNFFGKRYIVKCYLKYKKVKIDENSSYVFAFDHTCRNYYHWMIDTIPRLFVIKQELEKYKLLVPKSKSDFIKESISIFKHNGIIEIDCRERIRLKNVIIPGHVADQGRHNASILLEMRDYYIKSLPFSQSNTEKTEKIYASRSKQKYRKIENEHEVTQLLCNMGFTIVYFEEMSFWEQVSLMSKCKYFVSSHGANLTNILFMP